MSGIGSSTQRNEAYVDLEQTSPPVSVPTHAPSPPTSPLSPRAVGHLYEPLETQPSRIKDAGTAALKKPPGQVENLNADSPQPSPLLGRKIRSQVDGAPNSPVVGHGSRNGSLPGSRKASVISLSSLTKLDSLPQSVDAPLSPTPKSARLTIFHEPLKIPGDVQELVESWHTAEGWKESLKPEEKADADFVALVRSERNQNLAGLKGNTTDSHGNIIPSQQTVMKCLIKFRDDFDGSWAKMKEECTDRGLMQVINDVRASELALCLADVSKNFGILNCGSTKLTSDCDFALISPSENQADEAKGVAKFNDSFESRWGRSSASTFDSNAYTMQYSVKCSDPNNEKVRGTQQLKFSRVMANMQKDPQSIKKHNEALLQAVEPSKRPQLEKFINSVAKKAEWAELKVKQGMIDLVLKLSSPVNESKQSAKEGTLRSVKGFDYFKADDEAKEGIRKTYSTVVEAAFQDDPVQLNNVKVKAENAIHLELKGGARIENLQKAMVAGQKTIDNLRYACNGAEFVQIHNEGIKNTIEYCRKAIDETDDPEERQFLEDQIVQLETKILEVGQGDKALKVFKKYDMVVRERNAALELLNGLQPKYARIVALGAMDNKDAKTQAEIKKLQSSICSLLHIQHGNIGVVLFECREKIKELEKNREGLNNKVNDVEDEHGSLLAKAIGMIDAKDKMVVRYQNAQLEGMLFAQEAHVGEGAFDYTVRDLQKGDMIGSCV